MQRDRHGFVAPEGRLYIQIPSSVVITEEGIENVSGADLFD